MKERRAPSRHTDPVALDQDYARHCRSQLVDAPDMSTEAAHQRRIRDRLAVIGRHWTSKRREPWYSANADAHPNCFAKRQARRVGESWRVPLTPYSRPLGRTHSGTAKSKMA